MLDRRATAFLSAWIFFILLISHKFEWFIFKKVDKVWTNNSGEKEEQRRLNEAYKIITG